MNRMVFVAKKMAFITRWYAMNRMVFVATVAALVLTVATHCYHHMLACADGGNSCGDYSDCHSGPGDGSGGGDGNNS